MKTKTIKKQFQINEETFHSSLYLFIGYSFDEMVKTLKAKWPDFSIAEKYRGSLGLTFTHEAGLNYNFIWIPFYNGSIHSQGVLAHELLHFSMETMRQKNIQLSEESCNEPICYLYEYYLTKILSKLKG